MKLEHWVRNLFFLLLISVYHPIIGQTVLFKDTIRWKAPIKIDVSKDLSFTSLQFEDGAFPSASSVNPIYSHKKSIYTGTKIQNIRVVKLNTIPISSEEHTILDAANASIDTLCIVTSIFAEQKKTVFNS